MVAAMVGRRGARFSAKRKRGGRSMDIGGAKISCAPVGFALQYRDTDEGLVARKVIEVEARGHAMMRV